MIFESSLTRYIFMDCVRVADQILNLKVMVSRVSGKAEGKVGKETDVLVEMPPGQKEQ